MAASGLGDIAPEADAVLVDLAQRWRAAWPEVDRICDDLEAAELRGDVAGQAACHRRSGAVFATLATIEEAIAAAPAHGAEGLAVKAALLARVFLGPHEPLPRNRNLARSLAADALRLAPFAAEVEA
ncbi:MULTISPECIES: hypothetical protein [Roseomonadaceae]|uniref:HPt domain-containing protein n=1 Tax=Falsiroseomonas oleicola TaxID=2801474 RepID=A0ABS6H9Z4_9PROT|nr:hypothetical protein [Roseomonas oleicola]MBU8544316.1 hypothetical protein [Roseomonas oleicola]